MAGRIALLALQASFMISYASAKAEALQVKMPRGLMRRHERAAVLTLVAGLTPLLGPCDPRALGRAADDDRVRDRARPGRG